MGFSSSSSSSFLQFAAFCVGNWLWEFFALVLYNAGRLNGAAPGFAILAVLTGFNVTLPSISIVRRGGK